MPAPCHREGDLVGSYAVDALDSVDRARFEHHLEGCTACRAELVKLRLVVAALGGAVEPVEPPPELRAKILAACRR